MQSLWVPVFGRMMPRSVAFSIDLEILLSPWPAEELALDRESQREDRRPTNSPTVR